MTPALISAEMPENHLQGSPCRMLKHCGFFSVLPISDHLSQQKVKIPTTYGKSPTRSAGRCSLAGGAKATPGFYPAHFSTPRFIWPLGISLRPSVLHTGPHSPDTPLHGAGGVAGRPAWHWRLLSCTQPRQPGLRFLPLHIQFQSMELLIGVVIHRLLNWPDVIQQSAIERAAILCPDHCLLSTNESLIFLTLSHI